MDLTNIYTYAGMPAQRNLTIAQLRATKGQVTYTQTGAQTADEAQACVAAGIDILSVSDVEVSMIPGRHPHHDDHRCTGLAAVRNQR